MLPYLVYRLLENLQIIICVCSFKMAQVSLEIPENLKGLVRRPLFKPTLISSCLSSLLPHQLACPKNFEDHVRKHMGEKEVIAIDKGGKRHIMTYNKVFDGEGESNDQCLAILDHSIPKENVLLSSLKGLCEFKDDIYLDFLHSIGRGHSDSRYCVVYTDKGFFSGSHVDPMCTLGWMALMTGKKLWYFWDRNDSKAMKEWKSCMQEGKNRLPAAQYSFVAEAGSLVFIPPGWPHAVYTSEKCLGIGGSMLTLECLHDVTNRWDWGIDLYPQDRVPMFRNIKLSLGKLYGFSKLDMHLKLLEWDNFFNESLLKVGDESFNIEQLSRKRGRKPGKRKTTRPKPLVIFGKKPRGAKVCEDPEHDPTKRKSCGRNLSSYAYGFLISPVCGACYKRNHVNIHFHGYV